MKNLMFLLMIFSTIQITAQENWNNYDLQDQVTIDNPSEQVSDIETISKLSGFLSKVSFTATAGTGTFAVDDLNSLSLKKLSQVSLGELNISYKVNSRFSAGLSTMGALGSCMITIQNGEGQEITITMHDDDDDGPDDDDDGPDDMDDPNENEDPDDDDDDECDGDFGQNVLGTFTYRLSDKIPFFVQAAAGYSFGQNAPAYTALIAYNQRILAGLGIQLGIRFSDTFPNLPQGAKALSSSGALKAELGVNWNF